MKENLLLLFTAACILSYYGAISQEVKWIANKDTFFVNEKVTFNNISRLSGKDSTFIWNFGDDCRAGPIYLRKKCNVPVSGKSNEFHVYTRPGTYTISLIRKKTSDIFRKQITVILPVNHLDHRSTSWECILNGGFEVCTAIPSDLGQIDLSDDWYSPTNATPDLFHADFDTSVIYDFSVQVPDNFAGHASESGSLKAYAGCIALATLDTSGVFPDPLPENTNYREYIQQLLNKPLENGIKYKVTFYSRLSSHSRFAAKIGLCLSKEQLTADSTAVIHASPLICTENSGDTSEWVKTSFTYTATGGERYITIGNFSDDRDSPLEDAYPGNRIRSIYGEFIAYVSYYYIDRVSIQNMSNLDIERSTLLSSGNSFRGTAFSIDYSIGQQLTSTYCTGNIPLCLTQGLLQPEPAVKEDKGFSNTISNSDLTVYYYPNPTENQLYIRISDPVVCQFIISAYDLMGNKMMVLTRNKDSEDAVTYCFDLSAYESGTYIFRVSCMGKNPAFIKIIKL